MVCKDCIFHHSGYLWNKCDLTGSEYYHEYYNEPCPCFDDNDIFTEDCEPLGIAKGESVTEFMKCGEQE